MSYDDKTFHGSHRRPADWFGLIFGWLIIMFVLASYAVGVIMLFLGWLS